MENLYKQVLPNYLRLDIYLTDDGCTDGTPEAIKRQFPKVHIIKGDGNLFWNRGMYRAWEEAAKQDYNFYLWLNDDSYLVDGALFTLFCKMQSSGRNSSTNEVKGKRRYYV